MRRLLKARKALQTASALFFFALSFASAGPVLEATPFPMHVYSLLDPASAAATMLAARAFIAAMAVSLLTLLSAAAFGRAFCGFICPLGALLDGWRAILAAIGRKPGNVLPPWAPRFKYLLLGALAILAIFEIQAYGWFAPASLLGRTAAFVVHPYADLMLRSIGAEPAVLARWGIMGQEHPVHAWGFVSLAAFLALLAAESARSRFWCRTVCPTGALLGLAGKFRLVRISFTDSCNSCGTCGRVCPTGAIDSGGKVRDSECTMCMTCLAMCPKSALVLSARGIGPAADDPSPLPERRALLVSVLMGLLTVPMFNLRGMGRERADRRRYARLLRPPGSLPEREFLQRCVRCGQCMRACPTNGLQPLLVEAGLESAFTPVLVPRAGYCEFGCSACGRACPTGAIRTISVPKEQGAGASAEEIERANGKYRFRIGTASVDRSRCIPWADGEPCSVCEEHCPTHDKAIKMIGVEGVPGAAAGIRAPRVDKSKCIGCGTCEYVCPLAGQAAIRVERLQRNSVSSRFGI